MQSLWRRDLAERWRLSSLNHPPTPLPAQPRPKPQNPLMGPPYSSISTSYSIILKAPASTDEEGCGFHLG